MYLTLCQSHIASEVEVILFVAAFEAEEYQPRAAAVEQVAKVVLFAAVSVKCSG